MRKRQRLAAVQPAQHAARAEEVVDATDARLHARGTVAAAQSACIMVSVRLRLQPAGIDHPAAAQQR